MFYSGNRPGLQPVAVHEAGIQFMGCIAGKDRSDTRVKQRTLLKQPHRFRHRIQRAGTCRQHFLPAIDDR